MGFLDMAAKGVAAGMQKMGEKRQVEEEQTKAEELQKTVNNDYALFLKSEPAEYEKRKRSLEINRRFRTIPGTMVPDFSAYDDIDPSYRPQLIKFIDDLLDNDYHRYGLAYLADEKDSTSCPDYLYIPFEAYTYFEEFRDKLAPTLRHKQYFQSHEAIGSCLTMWDDEGNAHPRTPEQIHRLMFDEDCTDSPFVVVNNVGMLKAINIINWYPKRSKYGELIQTMAASFQTKLEPSAEELLNSDHSADWSKGVNIILAGDREESDYTGLKIALILSAMEPIDKDVWAKTYEFVRDAAILLLSVDLVYEKDREDILERLPPIDLLIADALVYKSTNNLSKINSELNQYLDLYAEARFDRKVEFTTLANFFASIQAFEQEMLVLDKMVEHNIPREEQQVARLAFLHAGGAENAGKAAMTSQIEYTEEEGKLAIDYRALSWDEHTLSMQFDASSGMNKLAVTPLVVAEWNKNINTKGVKWDSEAVFQELKNCVEDNFGDEFASTMQQVGIVMDGDLDYTESVVIMPSGQSKYPWLGFILSGEQMTRKQASISLFAVYFPELDFTDESSNIQRNKKAANRAIMLRMKQNPKINNFIETMQSIVIDELEGFFNRGEESGSIY